MFYDVVDYLCHKKLTPRLRAEIPRLLQRPHSEQTLREHIRIISEFR